MKGIAWSISLVLLSGPYQTRAIQSRYRKLWSQSHNEIVWEQRPELKPLLKVPNVMWEQGSSELLCHQVGSIVTLCHISRAKTEGRGRDRKRILWPGAAARTQEWCNLREFMCHCQFPSEHYGQMKYHWGQGNKFLLNGSDREELAISNFADSSLLLTV